MMQLLQTLMADRENERAERQANLAALHQLAQNNQGHGNHDHPGSKLKNFQNTNPPVFSKTEEPLDADDWLQTMENNLEVAGVEAAEKVLFATHYLAGPARAWWTSTRDMNAGQIMTWADFKLKFSKYHVPPGLIKKMRDEFRELKQGRMSVVEYRDRFLTLSRYAPDETDTTEKRKERFLNGLHDEMQTVLVNIPFADLEALVDSAIQMEGKLHQANENRKRRMMHQSGPSNPQKYRPSSSGGFAPRNYKPQMQTSRPGFQNRSGGHPRSGGHNNYSNNTHHNNNNFNRAPIRAPNNNNTNTAPRTGSNAIPVAPKDKSTITCYECGIVGHYSNECPKRLAKTAPNTAAPAQQQRRVSTGRKFTPNNPNNRNGRLFHMSAEEAQEAPDVMLEVRESQVFGPDVLREAEEKVHKIREYLKTAQSRQKSNADKRRREMTFEIGILYILSIRDKEWYGPSSPFGPEHAMPWHGMDTHLLSLSLVTSALHHRVIPSPLTPLRLLDMSIDALVHRGRQNATCPVTRTRARACIDARQSTHGHDVAPTLHATTCPRRPSAPAPSHQETSRHDRLTAGTLWPSSPSTRPATAMLAPVKLTRSPVPHFPRNQALRHRQDVACPRASSPVPLRCCSHVAMDDFITAPRPRLAAIKGGPPAPIQAHHRLPLSSQPLLATSLLHIAQ
ncbi:hypothetical protein QYE76_026392 [Lolium multiflorum]|uniref:CCHC-type domain-containing protein n=1 Tax=Lolium multiflorum TaxID=4521 RepID=A0AAD8RHG3_LOLMU|nr:hypothetical protein QYE76_026392 [Lolium multiflorum]